MTLQTVSTAGMVTPSVHLNGTSGEALLEQITDALSATKKLEEALGRAAPHGRDYYMHENRLAVAIAQHNDRLDKVKSIRVELEHIGRSIIQQMDGWE